MTSWAARVVRVLEQKDGHDRPGGESLLLLDRKFHLLSQDGPPSYRSANAQSGRRRPAWTGGRRMSR